MAKKILKNMKLNSVDLCKRGCNPAADIKLLKSINEEGGGEEKMDSVIEKIAKAVVQVLGLEKQNTVDPMEEMESIAKAWQESTQSIWSDETLSAEQKAEMFQKSLTELTEYTAEAIPTWAGIEKADDEEEFEDDEEDEADEEEDFDEEEAEEEEYDDGKTKKKEEETKMAKQKTIDVTKMSPEDKLALEALEKKYASEEEEVAKSEELHPEVKKALDDVQELRKSLEMKEMTEVAKKYEVIGKKVDETAEMLYNLKKSSPEAYASVTAAYDEMVNVQENTGIFKELGSNNSGAGRNDLDAAVAEIKKAQPTISHTDAVEQAYRNNPGLSEV